METIREYLDKAEDNLLTITKQRAMLAEILLPVSRVTSQVSFSLTGMIWMRKAVTKGGVMVVQIVGNEDD